MLDRQEGLTDTYNRFHDPNEAAAYGWNDLDPGHDFRETPQGIRFTISESARMEVLDRLLELNHQRYEEEVKAGLHNKKKSKQKSKSKVDADDEPELF